MWREGGGNQGGTDKEKKSRTYGELLGGGRIRLKKDGGTKKLPGGETDVGKDAEETH